MSIKLGDDGIVNLSIYQNKIYLKGTINASNNNDKIIWWASNPIEYRNSYSGSGLPFPNPEIAYENTPLFGKIDLIVDNTNQENLNVANFEIVIDQFPNSYYVANGTILLEPRIMLKIQKNNQKIDDCITYEIVIGNNKPYRHLTYQNENNVKSRDNCLFYDGRHKLPFGTQENILRRSAYPIQTPKNYWGLKPPEP